VLKVLGYIREGISLLPHFPLGRSIVLSHFPLGRFRKDSTL